jgi:hypothetical protein
MNGHITSSQSSLFIYFPQLGESLNNFLMSGNVTSCRNVTDGQAMKTAEHNTAG